MANQNSCPEPDKKFGTLLRSTRDEKGWSQSELAKRSRVALRTIVNIETAKPGRKVRFDVVIRLAAALEKSPREWLKLTGHTQISDQVISHVLKKSGYPDFDGQDEPADLFKRLEDLIRDSGPVLVSFSYCTFSTFGHQEFFAEKIAPLVESGKLFVALVCAYPKIPDLEKAKRQTLSRIYLQIRSEVIGVAKAIKDRIKSEKNKAHVAAFSLRPNEDTVFFPQVGLSAFRQILIQTSPPDGISEKSYVYELSTWITFFSDQRDRWIRVFPAPESLKLREDTYRKICSAWRDYLFEVYTSCDLKNGWSKPLAKSSPWEMADII